MKEAIRKARTMNFKPSGVGIFFCIMVVLAILWHERSRWAWPATWISGSITTGLGFINSNAAAIGVLATVGFGALNWLEKRKQTRAVIESARGGTLHVSEAGE